MLPLRIEGHTRVLAEDQDDLRALAIRDEVLRASETSVYPAMVSSWEPTPYELKVLNSGGSIRLTIIGRQHPAVMLGVHEAPSILDFA